MDGSFLTSLNISLKSGYRSTEIIRLGKRVSEMMSRISLRSNETEWSLFRRTLQPVWKSPSSVHR